MNIRDGDEAEFNRVYDTEHVPMLSQVPGVTKVSRYRLEKTNDPKMQKYLAIYEIDSPEIVDSPAWKEKGEWGDWAPKIRPHTTERHHSFFDKIPKLAPRSPPPSRAPPAYLVSSSPAAPPTPL